MWGSSYVASKLCILGGMQPFETLFYRFFAGAVIIGVLFRKKIFPIPKKLILPGVCIGLSYAIAFIFEIYGLGSTDASKASFLTSMNIVFFSLMYCVAKRITIRLHTILAFTLSMVGVGLLSLTAGFGKVAIGDLMLLMTALGYGVGGLITALKCQNYSSLQVVWLQFTTTAVLTGVLALFQGSGAPFPVSAYVALAFLIALPTIVCFFIKAESMKHISPILCALLFSTMCVFGAIASFLLLHERPTPRALLGALLITVGIVIESLFPVEDQI